MADESRDAEVESLFELVRRRYGERLSDEEMEEVRKGVENIAEASDALRAVKLDNSDEPFSVFTPFRGGD